MIFRDITSLGSFSLFVFLLLIVLAFQEIALFYKLLFGLVFTLLVIIIIRSFNFRNRPRKEKYSNFAERINASSFPSLHAARVVFITLAFISFSNQIYATILLAIAAIVIMYSRFYLKKHDLWDIAGGIVLGVLTWWITSFF